MKYVFILLFLCYLSSCKNNEIHWYNAYNIETKNFIFEKKLYPTNICLQKYLEITGKITVLSNVENTIITTYLNDKIISIHRKNNDIYNNFEYAYSYDITIDDSILITNKNIVNQTYGLSLNQEYATIIVDLYFTLENQNLYVLPIILSIMTVIIIVILLIVIFNTNLHKKIIKFYKKITNANKYNQLS